MEAERLSKKKLKLIARIWAGSMLTQLDRGFDNTGLNIDDECYIVEEAIRHGTRILNGLPENSDLNEIIKNVKAN